jgi:uncharacterized protein
MDSADPISTSFVLYLDEIKDGKTRYDWLVSVQDLGVEEDYYAFPDPVKIDLKVERSLQTFRIKADMCCVLHGECCRCLEMAQTKTTAMLEILVQRKEASPEELAAMEEDEDVVILDPGTRKIDLREYLRQVLLLEIPLRVYCQSECKGLCSQCGQVLNNKLCVCTNKKTDERWAALGDLKFS